MLTYLPTPRRPQPARLAVLPAASSRVLRCAAQVHTINWQVFIQVLIQRCSLQATAQPTLTHAPTLLLPTA